VSGFLEISGAVDIRSDYFVSPMRHLFVTFAFPYAPGSLAPDRANTAG